MDTTTTPCSSADRIGVAATSGRLLRLPEFDIGEFVNEQSAGVRRILGRPAVRFAQINERAELVQRVRSDDRTRLANGSALGAGQTNLLGWMMFR